MAELAPGLRLLMCNPQGQVLGTRLADLLPWAFAGATLQAATRRSKKSSAAAPPCPRAVKKETVRRRPT
jgi:hypothetical protein